MLKRKSPFWAELCSILKRLGVWRIYCDRTPFIWLGIKKFRQGRAGELPLVISDHADWDELTATLDEVAAPEVWIQYGPEAALRRHLAA